MEPTTYVLIPGAWHGGWAWGPVAKRLRARGHRAVALTLPGLGVGEDPSGRRLEDAVSHVAAALERETNQVTLVGHSWGGYPMVGAMHRMRHRVAKGIFYNALIPAPGRSMVDDTAPPTAQILRNQANASPNRAIELTLETVAQLYLHNACADAQRLLTELLTPQPEGYFFDVYDGPEVAALGLPLAYIFSDDDRVMPCPGTEFAARLGVVPIIVPGGHDGLLTQPDAVTEAILRA